MCYRSPDGTQHQVSSKLPNKPSARNQAMHLALELECASKKTATPALDQFTQQVQAQKLSKKAMGIIAQSAPQPTLTPLRELIGRWLEAKELSNARNTHVRYHQVAKDFITFVGASRLDMPPSYIQPQDVQGFIFKLAKKGQTALNCAVKLKILRNLFKMATRQGMITHNPAEAVDTPRGVRHTREPFTVTELEALLFHADQNWKLMILLGTCAGMRIGDAASLSWNNIDLEKKMITYLPKKKAHQPGAQKVTLPIHSYLLEAILDFPVNSKTPTAPLMPALARLSSAGRSGLSSQFGKILIKAGIDTLPEKSQGQRTFQAKTFHSLRHSFVSIMANNKVNQEIRKDLAGHDSDVHRVYSHFSYETYRNAIESIPRFIPRPLAKAQTHPMAQILS